MGVEGVRLRPGMYVGGIGIAAVSALSERCEVETTRAGQRWAIATERGVVVARRLG